ncbi:MAG: hypothetical protein AAF214_07080 [Pseudomonadota bacterium]
MASHPRYFDGREELYDHKVDPDEWKNLAGLEEHTERKAKFAKKLPKKAAPLVVESSYLHNVVDADKPSLTKEKKTWADINKKIDPPILPEGE